MSYTTVPGDSSKGSAQVSTIPFPDGPFPQDFGRYRLLRHLGGGGMGSVYLAEDLLLEIRVALKVPHLHIAAEPGLLERFYREARTAARLDHPGLCWVLDVGQVEGIHYIVMKYIEGTPLSKCPPREPRAAAALVRAVAEAMAAAHRGGVVHRDLKPDNILVTPRGEPVVADFGVALLMDPGRERMTTPGQFLGTRLYMAPEQLLGDLEAMGPACDVYSLGVILYKLLAGRVPYKNPVQEIFLDPAGGPKPAPPSTLREGIDPALEAICLKALALKVAERYASMDELAADLDAYLGPPVPPTRPPTPRVERPEPPGPTARPLVRREEIRFAFAGMGDQVPPGGPPPDRLYLDVGNDRRPGVLDHHHRRSSYGGSTARLVLAHPELIDGAVDPRRGPDDPFTIVLHEKPDLDCVASAFLAIAHLTAGAFPDGSEALARYVDKVDEGSLGLSLSQPFSLYAALMQVLNRSLRRPFHGDHERWRACVVQGLELTAYVVDRAVRQGLALPTVDAFSCPGLFGPEDRREVETDIERFHRKLAEPRTHTRQVRLRLPGQYGGTQAVEALLGRDVQNADDPDRCLFFKDWARSDATHAGNGQGFLALSVFMSESARQGRRCILSVTPDSGTSLRGLGEHLDRAEADRRRAVYGVDDRVTDPATGSPKPARTGYDNADPWYDGRAHGYTIVDSPRSGTLLTAEEIEGIFLKFGGVE